ncbi:MAG: hypothetical protein JWO80_4587 [Bryobacterales bacterium]|nr:hypothetical protein [Bryobacterales bacterium]
MKHLLLTLFAAIAAWAAPIDGVVMNGTTGKPQVNATVTLYRVGQNGPESIQSVKTDAEGKFMLTQDIQGPRLLQAAYDGVTYNHMVPPGTPSSGIMIAVYKSIDKPGGARVDQHMLLLEPTSDNRMAVSEGYIWENNGKTTFNDPEHGTLRFYLPAVAQGQVVVNVVAPQGMPIRRAPDKTETPDVYKIDFPIKPGQSQVQISYSVPFTSPGEFDSKVFYQGGPTRVIVPQGVTVQGTGLKDMGTGPMSAKIYSTDSPDIKVQLTGTGTLKQDTADAGGAGQGGGGGQIAQIMPKLYLSGDPNGGFPGAFNSVKWIVLTAFAILGLGFALLYRASPVEEAKATGDRGRR